jgi:HAD superfamily phosphatase (TIGR01668 family)
MMRRHSILEVNAEVLSTLGIPQPVVLLDIDNTILAPRAAEMDSGVAAHVRQLSQDVRILLCTNNLTDRQRRVSETLNLPILMRAMKPLTWWVKPWLKQQHIAERDVIVVGDQWVTDVWLAKALRCPVVLLDPIAEDTHLLTRLLRRVEKRWKL